MLEIKNIYKTFNPGTVNEKAALKGLSLTLNEGDFVTVIGGNGAGKSTMLNAIAGVTRVAANMETTDFFIFYTPRIIYFRYINAVRTNGDEHFLSTLAKIYYIIC